MEDDLKAKINGHWQRGEGSIQDLARVYKISVDEVLEMIGQTDMTTIVTQGDMIDQTEAGPEVTVNPLGRPIKVPYTTN